MESTALNTKPSRTAIGTAFMRAVLAKEADPDFRCQDYLAALFLPKAYQLVVEDADRRGKARAEANKGAYEFMLARTKLIDRLFAEHLQRETSQIVLLGAGFDTRAWRFNNLNSGTRVFELDLPATQRHKRDCLINGNIKLLDNHSFVSTSFNLETLNSDLMNAGYDPAMRTFFIWEGVTHYLTEETVELTLQLIKDSSLSGSEVIFDYIYREVIDRHIDNEDTIKLLDWAEQSGEPFKFGIHKLGIDEFLERRGLSLIKNYSPEDLENEFLRVANGKLYGETTGFYCFAHAQT